MNLSRFFQRFALISVLLLVGSLVLAACGGDDDDDDDPTAASDSGAQTTATSGDGGEPTEAEDEATEPEDEGSGDLSGSINIDGSSTVYPVSQGVAEEFGLENSGVQITVGFSGTGGGFEKFCAGSTQISNASRPIKDEEVAACADAGVEFTEFQVAIDGLSVVVNPANDWVECLTVDQLTDMFGPESTVSSWSDVDPSYPDEEINFYIPGTDSGTFDYFTETIGGESGATRTENIVTSEDDNVLVTGIEGDEAGIGYFGYAYYTENQDRLKVLGIDSGNGCVTPNDETVQSGEYEPLSRPLFIYVNNAMLQEQPELEAFVEYYFTDGLAVVPEVGYVPYSDDMYQANLDTLAAVAAGEEAPMAPTEADEEATEADEEPTESADSGATEEEDEAASGDLSGSINADGSSTVFPVTQGVAEEFGRENSDVQITVGFSGTGGGFEKFCAGSTQISNASRPIKDEEVTACADAGVEFTEFAVAIDGLSVVVNPANDWVECLTMEQLSMMFGPESTVTTWADVDPSWPAEEIGFYIPGTDSGTFDYFTETVGGESGATRTEGIVTSEDDNVLVTGIEGDQYGIGYFGYAYYIENQDRLKVLGVDNGNGCIEPNDETVQSGEYEPLSRPLFIYVNNAMLAEQPELQALVEYYFTDGLIVVPEVGYVQYPDEIYQENLATLAEVAGS